MICKIEIINPKTNARSHIELQLSERVMSAAKLDMSVADFVVEMARQQMPEGYMILGTDFRTP
ncbi:MAG TPA: hypothetical protein VJ255_17320 [Candidatus Acidoferrum sp.]|jgi:hypothetical protein|nr:hypothetical protein [Candidatus Acidoferrum sp.]